MVDMYYGDPVGPADVLVTLPNGQPFVFKKHYTAGEDYGVVALIVISCISATAVAGLLIAIAVSAWNTRKSTSRNLFVKSHVAAYFISLLLCEVAQTVGSIMSIRWVNQKAVSYEPYCTAQGVMKHLSDVGSAYWSLIIALNTFWILFLRWRLRRFVLITGMIGGWSAIGAIVTTGPAAIQNVSSGPFYAISGYWCWIGDQYPSERITLDYLIMFLSAVLSFAMYILIFLRLRGNILVHGWHVTFRFHGDHSESAFKYTDSHVVNIAKGMLLYPVVYTILLLPIAICRFAEWTGHDIPPVVTVICDGIFLLSGFVNVVLFLTTRRVLPLHSVFPRGVSTFLRTSMAPSMTMMLPAMSTVPSTRASAYSQSSYSTDIEKIVGAYGDNSSVVTRPSIRLSQIPSAVTIFSATAPAFALDSARLDMYDRVPMHSAAIDRSPFQDRLSIHSAAFNRSSFNSGASAQSAAPNRSSFSDDASTIRSAPASRSSFGDQRSLHSATVDRGSFDTEVDVTSAYKRDENSGYEEGSPTITLPIPMSAFNPVFPNQITVPQPALLAEKNDRA